MKSFSELLASSLFQPSWRRKPSAFANRDFDKSILIAVLYIFSLLYRPCDRRSQRLRHTQNIIFEITIESLYGFCILSSPNIFALTHSRNISKYYQLICSIQPIFGLSGLTCRNPSNYRHRPASIAAPTATIHIVRALKNSLVAPIPSLSVIVRQTTGLGGITQVEVQLNGIRPKIHRRHRSGSDARQDQQCQAQ